MIGNESKKTNAALKPSLHYKLYKGEQRGQPQSATGSKCVKLRMDVHKKKKRKIEGCKWLKQFSWQSIFRCIHQYALKTDLETYLAEI